MFLSGIVRGGSLEIGDFVFALVLLRIVDLLLYPFVNGV
jgi:hypothetical protein